jgi:hypothetical protein
LKYNHSIISTRCCRASYGVLFNKLLGRNDRNTIRSRRNPINNREYALNQICWFIRQGEPIERDEPINRKFHRIIDPERSSIDWEDTVAISWAPAKRLPQNIDDGDAQTVCVIKSKLDASILAQGGDVMKEKQKGFGLKVGDKFLGFKVGEKYMEIEYEVLVFIGSADLRLEVRFAGKVIGGGERIPVKWMYTCDVGDPQNVVKNETRNDGVDPWWYGSRVTRL